jgi:predicted nucleotidyltransferase
LTLLQRVSALLARRGIQHAIIGAAALAAHGVARATVDIDLLATDPACLDEQAWQELRSRGVRVEIRRGDESDPLGGVVRIASRDESTIDLIVGKSSWQHELLGRASPVRIDDTEFPMVGMADLILLKLYAGGPQDAWDIDQLLDVAPEVVLAVEARLGSLPEECALFWRRIRAQRAPRADA